MQSALNVLNEFRLAIKSKTAITRENKTFLLTLIDTYQKLATDLLDVDLAISGKLRDFSLQEQTVTPLSKNLYN